MSNRFHNKFHRENHHSNPTSGRPDSSYDPIASYEAPFQGEFFSQGEILTTENLSAGKLIYDKNFNSSQWSSAYTTVQAKSGSWDSTFTTVQAKSGSWDSTFTTVQAKSGTWDSSIGGGGNIGYLPKFSTTKQLVNSIVYEDIGKIKIGNPPLSATLNVAGSYLQTANGNGHYVINIQDSQGRVNHYWNTLGGNSPVYINSNEGARKLLFGGNNQHLFQISTSSFTSPTTGLSGDPISWQNAFTITSGGKVGVGTDTPNTKFDVNGDSHIYGNGRIEGDLTIFGKLSTIGTLSYLDTVLTTTSAVSVVNIGGPVPALTVSQTGPAAVAQFLDDGNVALYISGAAASPGYVGVGTNTPATSFHINTTDALVLPVGDTAQRKDQRGAIRYNSQLSAFEGYNGAEWRPLGGGGVIDDDEDTYIDAENPDGSDNDELQFYTAGTQRVKINANGLIMQSGAITPTAGSGETNGIMFPKDPFNGTGDTAFIRYQQDAGEDTAFIFGTANDAKDRLTLQQQAVDLVNLAYGRVGINRIPDAAANEMLSVNGNVNIIDTANAANSVTFTGQTTTAGAATVITARNDFLRVEVNGVSRYIRLFDVV